MEAALALAEHQIERLRSRERMRARALVDARHQLVEASCASSVISEDVPLTPEAGLSSYPPFPPRRRAACLAYVSNRAAYFSSAQDEAFRYDHILANERWPPQLGEALDVQADLM